MGKHRLAALLCVMSLSIHSISASADEDEAADEAADETEDEDVNFPWFSLAPEIGYLHFFQSEVKSTGTELSSRHGLVVKGHLDLGGDGIALELVPLYSYQVAGDFPGDFHVVGGEINLVYRFSIGNVYPSLGIGFHGTYIFGNKYFTSGTELYGRVPVGFTWYFTKYLGLVVEFGFLFGGTGVNVKSPDDNITGTKAEELARLAGSLEFGSGFGIDLLAGLRFP